jgi:hypothetical protein
MVTLSQNGNRNACGSSVRTNAPTSRKKSVSEGREEIGVWLGRESSADQIAMSVTLVHATPKVDGCENRTHRTAESSVLYVLEVP